MVFTVKGMFGCVTVQKVPLSRKQAKCKRFKLMDFTWKLGTSQVFWYPFGKFSGPLGARVNEIEVTR